MFIRATRVYSRGAACPDALARVSVGLSPRFPLPSERKIVWYDVTTALVVKEL
jgi:hypothetical protein